MRRLTNFLGVSLFGRNGKIWSHREFVGKKVDYAHIPCLFHRMTRSSCGKSQVFWLITPALSPVKTVTVREKRRIGTHRKVKCSLLLGIVRNIIENRAGNCRSSEEKGNNLRFVTFPGDNFSLFSPRLLPRRPFCNDTLPFPLPASDKSYFTVSLPAWERTGDKRRRAPSTTARRPSRGGGKEGDSDERSRQE